MENKTELKQEQKQEVKSPMPVDNTGRTVGGEAKVKLEFVKVVNQHCDDFQSKEIWPRPQGERKFDCAKVDSCKNGDNSGCVVTLQTESVAKGVASEGNVIRAGSGSPVPSGYTRN